MQRGATGQGSLADVQPGTEGLGDVVTAEVRLLCFDPRIEQSSL